MVDIAAGHGETGAPIRELLTVAELTNRLSTDKRGKRTTAPRASRAADGPLTVEDLLRREGRSGGASASRSAPSAPIRPVAPQPLSGHRSGPPAVPPPTFRNVQPVQPAAPRLADVPSAADPDGCALPRLGPLAGPPVTDRINVEGMPGPGQPPTSPLMFPSVGPRAARRPSVRRPLAFGVAVAGAALFVGSVATSAPQDGRPLGPSDLVPLSEPTLPAAAAGGGSLGGAAAAPAIPAAHVTPVSEALPLRPPPLGKRAEPLNPPGAATLVHGPVESARSIPAASHAPTAPQATPTQPPQTETPYAPAEPGPGSTDDGSVADPGDSGDGSQPGGSSGDGSQSGGSSDGGSQSGGSDSGTPGDGDQGDRGGDRGGRSGATQRDAAGADSYSQPQTYAAGHQSDEVGHADHQNSERSSGRHHR